MSIKEKLSSWLHKLAGRRQGVWRHIINFNFKNKSTRKKLLLFSGFVIFLCLLLFFLTAPFFVSAARVELLSLRQEVEQGGPCHEGCRLARQERKEKIANRLLLDRKLQADLEKYFFAAEEISVELRRELMEIIFLATGGQEELPVFLADYLADSAGRPETKADIINFFLAPLSDRNLAEYYLAILESGEEEVLKKAALSALSKMSDKNIVWQVDDLTLISQLILDKSLSPGLRLDAFFLLSSYQEFFPEAAMPLFFFIKDSAPEPELKYLAAEKLLQLGWQGEAAPIPEEEAWLKYFD